ncbi:hypothetical protein CY0110_19922 [Crocosphaera chwakensis CCY0110]|uniref:Uncharacterized protein n=1 Tax=Crocosphaera chwakensis CCY0110 TaxID=391612 RepID=A3IJW6_9CHRO|nr:hypothetical protein CY0110_19922 [Crocosphaera chwakensis CCY0110]
MVLYVLKTGVDNFCFPLNLKIT